MEELIKESMDGFEGLWQRVTGHEEPAAEAQSAPAERREEDELLVLIHDEICAGAWSAALARMFQGDSRAVLSRHAADAKRHLRQLRAERFILTGAAAGGNEDCRPLAGRLALLRAAYLQAEQLAGKYARAAALDGGAPGEAYAAFAEDERRRARELRALLVASF